MNNSKTRLLMCPMLHINMPVIRVSSGESGILLTPQPTRVTRESGRGTSLPTSGRQAGRM